MTVASDATAKIADLDDQDLAPMPKHVAIIMDGNGRWATARGLGRTEGHRRGVKALRRAVRHAGAIGLEYLTLFSFSSENWSRPKAEIEDLMALLRLFMRRDLADLHRNNVRVHVVGCRDDLAPDILSLIEHAENLTRENTGLNLVVAFNYGSRDEILRAVRRVAEQAADGSLDPANIDADLITANLDTSRFPDPDLIIRTSGEQRLSNFLLWQAAYSEFVFLAEFWPEFDADLFDSAILEYRCRNRRYGGLLDGPAS